MQIFLGTAMQVRGGVTLELAMVGWDHMCRHVPATPRRLIGRLSRYPGAARDPVRVSRAREHQCVMCVMHPTNIVDRCINVSPGRPPYPTRYLTADRQLCSLRIDARLRSPFSRKCTLIFCLMHARRLVACSCHMDVSWMSDVYC